MNVNATPHVCLELAEFSLRPDTTPEALRGALIDLDHWLAQQPGFIRRRTLRDGSHLADLVEWRDRASAEAGAAAAMASPVAGRYFALLDLENARMRHFDVLA